MLSNPMVLDDADGTDITFNLVQPGFPDGTRRTDVSQSPQTPRVLNIRHSRTSSGSANVSADRHLVQIVQTVLDPDGRPLDFAVNFTVTVPRVSTVTPAMILDNVAIILDLLTDGALVNPMTANNLNSLLRGEA